MSNPFVKKVNEQMILGILEGNKQLTSSSIACRIYENMPLWEHFKDIDMVQKTRKGVEAKVKRIAEKSDNIKYSGDGRWRMYSVYTSEEKAYDKLHRQRREQAQDVEAKCRALGLECSGTKGELVCIHYEDLKKLVLAYYGNKE